ncbi:unnamed protein product [Adineta ricciae]|uniref:Rhamnogalacturonase A/B/Epimerase-like pectate lyase domain-containing protein n=1 Tax=Adineta ricciae TaxID=249248 RepID=A0A815DNI4_ADIRI|nr:unnamed protein product [Adineta ricciae]CAF1303449.1 unnamed protein product [Adineta ricciae]
MFRLGFLLLLFNIVSSTIFNIKDYGAVGDGITDDTNAILKAISQCTINGGVLYIPSGTFVIRSSLMFQTNVPFTISGDGMNSILLWQFDDHLIHILPSKEMNNEISEITIRDFLITSSLIGKSLNKFGIYGENLVKSHIEHLIFNSNDSKTSPISSGICFSGVADTNTVRDVIMWDIRGTGIEIGYGSEIRILGGRIIGANTRFDQSIGIHCTGNNGGVHIDSTDIIGLAQGVLIENVNGHGSNREIFINQATIDSNGEGLIIRDNSYVSIVGIWAASSTKHQVYVEENTSALLTISGGTIFNGGVYECPNSSNWCNGITIKSGSFILDGVHVRNNKGKGIWIVNQSVTQFQIISSRIFQNGQGLFINGSTFIISNNICKENQIDNWIFNTTSSIISNNLFC